MKKVLVATCVMAMTAFGITNASADPVSSARANAFGISIDLLGEELVEREPEVTSVFPPGGSEEEDVATIDAEELLLEGVGIQQAETSGESTISPMLVPDGDEGGGDDGGGLLGGGGGGDDGGGLLGGGGGGDDGGGSLLSLDELLGGGGDDGGDDGEDGFGGPDDDDIEIGAVNARALSSISITGVALDDSGEGGGGSNLFDDVLGGVLGGDDEEGGSGVGGLSTGEGEVQTQQVEDILGEGVGGDELTEIVFEALLRLGVVESEAVAVCSGNQVFFDVASRIVDDQGSDIELVGDLLDDVIGDVLDETTEELAPELIEISQGEVTVTEDGTVAIDALRITVGEELGGDILGGGDDEGGSGGAVEDITGGGDDGGGGSGEDGIGGAVEDITGGGEGGGEGGGSGDDIVPLQFGGGGDDEGEDEPLLEIVLGHSEVSGTVCAAQQAPPPPPPLPPAGDPGTLPVTGGGLGLLPGMLAVGLTGGALAAGRLALRARREHTL